MEKNFVKITCDHCVFVLKFSNDDFIILLIYVDDILIDSYSVSRIDKLKCELSKSFAMKDLGVTKQILNMQIIHDRKNKKL